MRSRQGFTLVELIISLALFAVLVSTLFYCFGQGRKNWQKIVLLAEKEQATAIIMERICRDVRSAAEVKTGETGDEIAITNGNESLTYGWKNNKIRMRNGKQVSYLTSDGETDKLSFNFLANQLIRIKIGSLATCVAWRGGQ